MKRIRVLLIQGGPSSEHDVSLNSGRMVSQNLDTNKYAVAVVTIGRDGQWTLPKPGEYDVAFIALHGMFGEDGAIQKFLEEIGLPYTGSGPQASALAMDKALSADYFRRAGLAVPAFEHITQENPDMIEGVTIFPAVVKPCHGGSSVGVSLANNSADATRAIKEIIAAGDSVIVQEVIVGREFTCGVLDDEQGIPQVLPPTEIIPKKGGMFDYEAKYEPGASQEVTPPNLPAEQIVALQQAALFAHRCLGCSGMSRSDFILHNGIFYILETNTIPGMTATSLLPQEAKVAGIDFSQMLDRMIQSGLHARRTLDNTAKIS